MGPAPLSHFCLPLSGLLSFYSYLDESRPSLSAYLHTREVRELRAAITVGEGVEDEKMPAQASSYQGKDGAMLVIPLLCGAHHLFSAVLEQPVDPRLGLRSRQSGAKALCLFFH